MGGAERLVRECSPDVLLVDASATTDPGWAYVRELRQRFSHARLPVVLIGQQAEPTLSPDVHVVASVDSAQALLDALEAAVCDGTD
jgi:DNA-binding NarL/FixJ family response regulator